MTAALVIYFGVGAGVSCAYAGFFREHRETAGVTVLRAAALGLVWPLLFVLLLMLLFYR